MLGNQGVVNKYGFVNPAAKVIPNTRPMLEAHGPFDRHGAQKATKGGGFGSMPVDEKAAQAPTGGVQREGTSWVLEPDQVPRTIRYQIGSQRCLSLVQPPTHWNAKEEMRRSGKLPNQGLMLEHVYGYGARGARAPDSNGYTSPAQRLFFNSQNWVMYEVASLGVALSTPISTPKQGDLEFKQKFFTGHNTDISCLTVDHMGVFVATGQVRARL
jgi:hypothetical protein